MQTHQTNTKYNRAYWRAKGFNPCSKCPYDSLIHSHLSKTEVIIRTLGALGLIILAGIVIFFLSYKFFSQ